jgi:sugar/nucleoside kinase (ribokinase family)
VLPNGAVAITSRDYLLMTFDLIAVGDVMLDGSLPEPVPGGRVHGHIELRPGGSAANAALAAARLGARALVIGRVGADAAGRLVRDALAEAGVEPLLASDESAATGCVVAAGTAIVADPAASARLRPDDLPQTLDAHAVLVSGYSLLQPGAEAAAHSALARAQASWLAIDVASAPLVEAFGVERFFDATRSVDVLLANAEEAHALTGLNDQEAALALGRRYRIACVKLGRDGAIAAFDGTVLRARLRPLEQVDALGAGDAFAAGFLLALAGRAQPGEALDRGTEAAEAAIVVNRPR